MVLIVKESHTQPGCLNKEPHTKDGCCLLTRCVRCAELSAGNKEEAAAACLSD